MFPRVCTWYMEMSEVMEGLSVHVHVACETRKLRFRAYAYVRYIEYGRKGGRRRLSVHAIINLEGLRSAVHSCCKVSHAKMRMCKCICVHLCAFVCIYEYLCVFLYVCVCMCEYGHL